MDSPFMNEITAGLEQRGILVTRFEFPYMQKRRRGEGGGPPDRAPVLEACFREQAAALGDPASLFIGGKSMGGRIATALADSLGVRAVVAFGYPFFPPKKATPLRVGQLQTLKTEALIVQGTRDSFGTEAQVRALELPSSISLRFIEDGDHSLEPRKKSGRTTAQNWQEAVDAAADFMAHRA